MMDGELLSRAILIYMGAGVTNYPATNVALLDAHFAPEALPELKAAVRRLNAEFWETGLIPGKSLLESVNRARDIFSAKHPELGDEAIDALASGYAFNHR